MKSPETTQPQGMVISLECVLAKAADQLERDWWISPLGYALRDLHRNLELLRENPERLAEFFRLYVK